VPFMKIESLIESAAEHLPYGWEIRIHVEKGSGLVIAVRPDGSEVAMCDGESDIAEQFRLAMCLAEDETAADLMANDEMRDRLGAKEL